MQEIKDKVFSIRLSKSEYEALKETAKCNGQTVGGYIRWILFGNREVSNNG